jgi:prepilin-type N-terminal cleavage/methylation domain-containing protein
MNDNLEATAGTAVGLPGFTLLELLVVITIIVVLVALLAPALDQAIYQAELATCAGRQKANGTGLTTYAFDFKRHYPHRDGVRSPDMTWWPEWLATPATQGGINRSGEAFDDRPKLRPYLSINGFNDPLSTDVDYDGASVDGPPPGRSGGAVGPSPQLWAGWVYKDAGTTASTGQGQTVATGTGYRPRSAGMFRIGDRWKWTEPGRPDIASTIIYGDQLNAGNSFGLWVIASHPDSKGVLSEFVLRVEDNRLDPLQGSAVTSRWGAQTWTGVGTFDVNHTYADGSVRRTPAAPYDPANDRRLGMVGISQTAAQTAVNSVGSWNALPGE